jgi:small subunit ribosomal protein S16
MALRLRLARAGTKKRPFYRIVVADSRSPRDGRYIEKIGTYNPMLGRDHANRVVLDGEKAKHWLGVGALPSDRVAKFLARAEIIEAPVQREQTKSHLPKKKAQERQRALAEAAAAAGTTPAGDSATAGDAAAG